MSLHLYEASHPHTSSPGGLRLLSAYENGAVTCRAYTRTDKVVSVEGIGWSSLWSVRLHVESGTVWFRSSVDASQRPGSDGYDYVPQQLARPNSFGGSPHWPI